MLILSTSAIIVLVDALEPIRFLEIESLIPSFVWWLCVATHIHNEFFFIYIFGVLLGWEVN